MNYQPRCNDPVNMPLVASTGPVLIRCCQHWHVYRGAVPLEIFEVQAFGCFVQISSVVNRLRIYVVLKYLKNFGNKVIRPNTNVTILKRKKYMPNSVPWFPNKNKSTLVSGMAWC